MLRKYVIIVKNSIWISGIFFFFLKKGKGFQQAGKSQAFKNNYMVN